MGEQQQNDKLIFERKSNPTADFDFMTTSDERYFVLKEHNRQKEIYNVYYIDYKAETPAIKPLLMSLKNDIDILDSHESRFISYTNKESNNGKVVEIDPENPLKWKPVLPDFADAVLLKIKLFTDRIITVYQYNQQPFIMVYNYSGDLLYKYSLPVASSVSGFSGNSTDEDLFYDFESYTVPKVVFRFNIKTFKSELLQMTTNTFSVDDIEYKTVEYLSGDTVHVPMVLVYKKGLKLDGKNPTILNAYGGFGVIDTPSFDPGIVYFIKEGGVYAFANIRGGGDKGETWSKQGKGKNKQNSFDDFIAAAEYLIKNKYTCKAKLAATGASNGGLVVAASAIQRPDLFRAVVPVVAPLDMLRYEKFTIGRWCTDEYGSVKDSAGFRRLLCFSPYQNIKEETNYPAMLIVTSDNDDRVPPFNSYKFAARLQSRIAQKNPILLKTEEKAGHHGATNIISYIKEESDIFGFIMNELMKD